MTNSPPIYTVVTFAPVQGFIEKSRKLRDLYGSSYILSFLAKVICDQAEAEGCKVISPALPDITQGLPNQIILEGKPSGAIEAQFNAAWELLVEGCREWIEEHVQEHIQGHKDYIYYWQRTWQLWKSHSWEFFHVTGEPGESISQVRQRLNEVKRKRAWIAVNWQGESSTLSGADAVAWPEMNKDATPKYQTYNGVQTRGASETKAQITDFYTALSYALGEAFAEICKSTEPEKIKEYGAAFIDPDEELSVPEMVKRLITHLAVIGHLENRDNQNQAQPNLQGLKALIHEDLNVKSFKEVSRLAQKSGGDSYREWTGWFMGDGDGASDYLKWVGQQVDADESEETKIFSEGMRHWGQKFKGTAKQPSPALPEGNGRVIYAGGDDFLGVLYDAKPDSKKQLAPQYCLKWLSRFQADVWNGLEPWSSKHEKITASVGFVWASPQVPQRDVLQHARLAEKSAKSSGKDRVAMRVLFAGGNHLEWTCPWRLLEQELFQSYRDRNGIQNALEKASWTHFYNDVAILESRHGFGATLKESPAIAIALFNLYFAAWGESLSEDTIEDEISIWWNQKNEYKVTQAGILGDRQRFGDDRGAINQAINEWIINLAKVGFYLCSSN